MPTGWNYVWGESWKDYVSRSTETRDEEQMHRESTKAMFSAISGQTASILTGMRSMDSQITSSMDKGFSQVNSTMERGFNEVSSSVDRLGSEVNRGFIQLSGHMYMIADEIAELNETFEWGFSRMIAQMGGMKDSLKKLVQIAKTPAQTAAYEQFEIARDAFNQGLYIESLESLDKAINGDHTSPGYKLEWRFYQMQGLIRLGFYSCDLEQIDPALAEQAFLLAARYAKANDPKEAAKAFLAAGWSAYVQKKSSEAMDHTQRAIALDSELTEAYFQAAKISMATDWPDEALPVLRKAVDQSPGYVLKSAADGDFKRHESELNEFFEAMRQETYRAIAPKVQQALKEAEEWAKTVSEVNEQKEILDRWRSLLAGDWGLLDLLKYSREGFEGDRTAVVEANKKGANASIRKKKHVKKQNEMNWSVRKTPGMLKRKSRK